MRYAYIMLLVLASLILSSCQPGTGAECSKDSDCVEASCCHASECVPSSEKPDCKGVLCSQECRPGTLDCGQGSCRCIDNKCSAVIN